MPYNRWLTVEGLLMSNSAPSTGNDLSADELEFIRDAAEYLENPSLLL
jgi:hypothetical protein